MSALDEPVRQLRSQHLTRRKEGEPACLPAWIDGAEVGALSRSFSSPELYDRGSRSAATSLTDGTVAMMVGGNPFFERVEEVERKVEGRLQLTIR